MQSARGKKNLPILDPWCRFRPPLDGPLRSRGGMSPLEFTAEWECWPLCCWLPSPHTKPTTTGHKAGAEKIARQRHPLDVRQRCRASTSHRPPAACGTPAGDREGICQRCLAQPGPRGNPGKEGGAGSQSCLNLHDLHGEKKPASCAPALAPAHSWCNGIWRESPEFDRPRNEFSGPFQKKMLVIGYRFWLHACIKLLHRFSLWG